MTLLLFISFIVFLIIGVPVAVSLGMASLFTILIGSDVPLVVGIQSIFTGIDSFPLMAIPFFVLAGNIMTAGGISKRLVIFASMIVGKITGGLAHVSIFASTIFAAISGSSPATTAAIGGVMMPEMNKRHYDKYFTGATVAAAGTVGMVIPPSIPMILYAVLAGVSVSDMFLAGILPGLLLVFSMAIVAYIHAKKNKIPKENIKYSFRDRIKILSSSFWALLMPIIILGGIYLGIFTPTEAAAVAIFYGLVVGLFIYKEIRLKDIPNILSKSASGSAVIMLIVAAASSFGWVLTHERIPQLIAESFLSLTTNPYILLILFNILLLITGSFLNPTAAIILLTPILLPVLTNVGLDPILIGVIMIVNLSIGQITPPVGTCLYVASNIGNLKVEKLIVKIIPYLIALIIALIIITYFEPLSMVLIE